MDGTNIPTNAIFYSVFGVCLVLCIVVGFIYLVRKVCSKPALQSGALQSGIRGDKNSTPVFVETKIQEHSRKRTVTNIDGSTNHSETIIVVQQQTVSVGLATLHKATNSTDKHCEEPNSQQREVDGAITIPTEECSSKESVQSYTDNDRRTISEPLVNNGPAKTLPTVADSGPTSYMLSPPVDTDMTQAPLTVPAATDDTETPLADADSTDSTVTADTTITLPADTDRTRVALTPVPVATDSTPAQPADTDNTKTPLVTAAPDSTPALSVDTGSTDTPITVATAADNTPTLPADTDSTLTSITIIAAADSTQTLPGSTDTPITVATAADNTPTLNADTDCTLTSITIIAAADSTQTLPGDH